MTARGRITTRLDLLSWITGPESADVLTRLLVALAAGGLIGIERSYHGRPAGFRTHTLVCHTSRLARRLMQVPSVVEFRIAPTGD